MKYYNFFPRKLLLKTYFILFFSMLLGLAPVLAQTTTIQVQVEQDSDDAEENIDDGSEDRGSVALTSSDLELIHDDEQSGDGINQLVGIRFQGVSVPVGAIIISAYIEFECDETSSGTTDLTIKGQAADNPATFTTTTNDISNRIETSASVSWSPDDWNTTNEKHQTSDIYVVIQEIIDRGGWESGNALVLIIDGTGQRIAESYNGESDNAPLLVINYTESSAPRITIGNTPLSPYSSEPGVASAEQSYTVSGANLTADISITAPPDFEISTTSGSGFGASVSLSQSGGSLAETPIYVRMNRAMKGSTNGDITHTSTDATSRNVAVSGTAAEPGDGWIAYNDCVYESGEDGYIGTNVSTFGVGSGFDGDTSGELLVQLTGDPTGITVSLTQSGDVVWNTGSQYGGEDAAEGTDAYTTFNGFADMTGVIQYNGDDWYVDLTFTGLDPAKLYTFATSASRNDDGYTERYAQYTLSSVDAATNSSTAGVNETSNLIVWFNTGDNHDEGYVARWTEIQPGTDGSFTVRAEAHSSAADDKAYAFDVFMLQEGSGTSSNQAPEMAVLVQPAVDATSVSISPTLEVTVSDDDGDVLEVTYYGRKVESSAAGADFTIIGIPDTQNESEHYPDVFDSQMQWIADNKTAENIAFVTHLGDLVNTANNEAQWINANHSMDILDAGGVSYSVGPGNHDLTTYTSTTLYPTYFGSSRFTGKSYYQGSMTSDNFNNYSFFTASGMDFILINLQYQPDNAMLDWADALLKANVDRQGIISSHSILETNNSFNSAGTAIFNALKDNPNVFLMMCGHMHSSSDGAAYREELGDDGHTIISIMLADYQDYPNGGNGYLRLLRFSPTENKIYVTTYSPFDDTYITSNPDQMEIDYEMEGSAAFEEIGTVSVASGANVSITWPDLDINSEYEWYAKVTDGSATSTSLSWSFTTGESATTFELTMAVGPDGGGTTNPVAGSYTYGENTVVSINATPESGYFFDHWEGACTGTGSCQVTMDAAKLVTAYFSAALPGILGDVNGDDLVNSTDALIILSCDVGLDISSFCSMMNAGDVNNDGVIDLTDALIILSFDVGISVPFPVGEQGIPANVTPCAGCPE